VSLFSDESGPELRALFFETAQELLQSLNEQALKLEKEPADKETLQELRRIVHTLKGDAAATGFRELSELSHQLEDALALDAAAAQPLADIAFTAADTFAAMLEAYRNGSDLPAVAPLRAMVKELAEAAPPGQKAGAPGRPAKASPWTEYELLTVQDAAARGLHGYHIRAVIDPRCAMPIAARQLVLQALAEVGEVLAIQPEAGSAASAKDLQVLFASGKTSDDIAQKCRVPTVISEASVEALAATPVRSATATTASPTEPDQKAASRKEPSAGPPPQKIQTPAAQEDYRGNNGSHAHAENILRVDAERIDNMISLVGELIIGKSMLQQALNEFAPRSQKDPMRLRFGDIMAFQARALNDLQRAVMKVRMVPVEQLFRRFPRMARDIAKQCGRQVEVVLQGQDTDLDKSLLDAIAEPLTHLVRNAVGHGIEPAEERSRAGKPAHGAIGLNAYHQGNQVVVEISDDGRGIDTRKVRTCAIERGLLNREAAAGMSESEVLEMIFRPGFSTAEQITEVSGRGVGLDVVGSVLSRLKGTVEVESDPGKGTRFRLRLPLTLAIIQALLFRVQQQLYAVPLNAVAEISRRKESALHQVEGREVLQLRDHVLPIIRLGRPSQEPAPHNDPKIFVLVVAVGDRRFGLLVDDLAGEDELVIKPLDDQTVETDLMSGASILGDGRVVLVLNLPAVVERFTKWRPEAGASSGFGLLLSRAAQARTASAGEAHP
jgi:two-component system chemotaxis sensor kinase CheA